MNFLPCVGKRAVFMATLSMWATAGFAQQSDPDSLKRAYVNLRFGMFIHFGIETFNGADYWNKNTPPAQSVWNLSSLNCSNWADAAKSAKMKFGVLTTKHHYGFCLWNTASTAYNCMNSGTLRTDVVKAYCDAFRADSLLPGLYYSMFDAYNGVDAGHDAFNRTLWNNKKTYIQQQLRELLTNYGPIPLLVIDGWAWRMGHNAVPYQEIREFVKSLQPNCLVCDHDGLSQPCDVDVVMFEEPKGVYCPVGNTYAATQGQIIVSQSSGSWFWTGGGTFMTAASILTHLSNLEPRYCNFLLNCPPTADGVLDQRIIDTLAKIGTNWTLNPGRAALPTQPHAIEHPVTPIAAAAGTGADAWNAIDGYNDVFGATSVGQTLWTGAAPPQAVTIDLGAKYYNLEILGYLPRQDYSGGKRNMMGNITGYAVSVSDDKTAFQQVASGAWAADSTYKIAEWTPPASGRYVRLSATSSNGATSVVVGEIGVGGRLNTPTTTPPAAVINKAVPRTGHGASPTVRITKSEIRVRLADCSSVNQPMIVKLFSISGVQMFRQRALAGAGKRDVEIPLVKQLSQGRIYICTVIKGSPTGNK